MKRSRSLNRLEIINRLANLSISKLSRDKNKESFPIFSDLLKYCLDKMPDDEVSVTYDERLNELESIVNLMQTGLNIESYDRK